MNYHRYLVYEIDKRQKSPTLYRMLPPHIYKDADSGLTVIVDLWANTRYVDGEWEKVETIDQLI